MHRLGLIFLVASAMSIVGTSLFAGAWSEAIFLGLCALFPVALIVVGASRGGRLGPLLPVLLALAGVLVASVAVMALLRGRVEEGPWLFGLPLAAWVQLAGLCVVPTVIVSIGYARTFDRWTLRAGDLDRLRALAPPGSDE